MGSNSPANDLFSIEARRNPYPIYDQMRQVDPVCQDPASGLWMLFDYKSVKTALSDHTLFSSQAGPAEWMIFLDPPCHSNLRALVSQAFTPRSIASLEPRIRAVARELLDAKLSASVLDLAGDFAVPLPMMVIASMLGVPESDRARFKRWNEMILRMSYTVPGGSESKGKREEFIAATAEMDDYLASLVRWRQAAPADDLLTRLVRAEVDGEKLTRQNLVGFFQLLLLAGSETTTHLINNAVLCFMENPVQLARLKSDWEVLPSAIEEVLRYRSPLQWMLRITQREVQIQGKTIPARAVVLAMIGSANRDPRQFQDPNRFDIDRNPNPHIAFGQGLHSCLGAALARLEGKIALREFLARAKTFSRASLEPWLPSEGLHVHGPARLPLQVEWARV